MAIYCCFINHKISLWCSEQGLALHSNSSLEMCKLMSPSSLDKARDIYTARRLSLLIRKLKKQRADFLQVTNCIHSRTRSSSELSPHLHTSSFQCLLPRMPGGGCWGLMTLSCSNSEWPGAPLPVALIHAAAEWWDASTWSAALQLRERGERKKKKGEARGFSFPGQVVQETLLLIEPVRYNQNRHLQISLLSKMRCSDTHLCRYLLNWYMLATNLSPVACQHKYTLSAMKSAPRSVRIEGESASP